MSEIWFDLKPNILSHDSFAEISYVVSPDTFREYRNTI